MHSFIHPIHYEPNTLISASRRAAAAAAALLPDRPNLSGLDRRQRVRRGEERAAVRLASCDAMLTPT